MCGIYGMASLSGVPLRHPGVLDRMAATLVHRGPDAAGTMRLPFADLHGMFAIALWDEGSRRLVLARDRAGEKPLFYAECGDSVCFASEVPALLQHPEVSRGLDHHALEDFLTFGYVREPRTMFAG